MQRQVMLTLLGLTLSTAAWADSVKVENAWVRATAPGQKVAAGFLELTADADMKLVGGRSPVSNTLELHTMKMEGGVMQMRQIPEIALPKGKTVRLQPGGLHVMFIGLKQPIKEGDEVPVTLSVKNATGQEQQIQVQAKARSGGSQGHQHH
jgi:copper(I)-binding protein